MDKPNLSTEIESIESSSIRTFTKEVFKKVPSYFWTLPASSTGKYHPPRERAAYGLVYHTKEVFRIGQIMWESYEDVNLDEAKAAILLHDIGRYGLGPIHSQWSRKDHPQIAVALIEKVGANLDVSYYSRIARAVGSHMGRWGSQKPVTNLDWLVHLADCVAAKNYTE